MGTGAPTILRFCEYLIISACSLASLLVFRLVLVRVRVLFIGLTRAQQTVVT